MSNRFPDTGAVLTQKPPAAHAAGSGFGDHGYAQARRAGTFPAL
jgi:hypothetical protein